jgi:hypothetical protein
LAVVIGGYRYCSHQKYTEKPTAHWNAASLSDLICFRSSGSVLDGQPLGATGGWLLGGGYWGVVTGGGSHQKYTDMPTAHWIAASSSDLICFRSSGSVLDGQPLGATGGWLLGAQLGVVSGGGYGSHQKYTEMPTAHWIATSSSDLNLFSLLRVRYWMGSHWVPRGVVIEGGYWWWVAPKVH